MRQRGNRYRKLKSQKQKYFQGLKEIVFLSIHLLKIIMRQRGNRYRKLGSLETKILFSLLLTFYNKRLHSITLV